MYIYMYINMAERKYEETCIILNGLQHLIRVE